LETNISQVDQDILDWLTSLGLSYRSWKKNRNAVARLQTALEKEKTVFEDLQLVIYQSSDLQRNLPKNKTLHDILEYYWNLGKITHEDDHSKLATIVSQIDGVSRARVDIAKGELKSLMKTFLEIKDIESKISKYLTDDNQIKGNQGITVSWRDCKYYSSITSEICGPLLLWMSKGQNSISHIIDSIIRGVAEEGHKGVMLRCDFEKNAWMLKGYTLQNVAYTVRSQEISPFATYLALTDAGYTIRSSIPLFPQGQVSTEHFRFLMAKEGESHRVEVNWN
jgi:hypothetical protein